MNTRTFPSLLIAALLTGAALLAPAPAGAQESGDAPSATAARDFSAEIKALKNNQARKEWLEQLLRLPRPETIKLIQQTPGNTDAYRRLWTSAASLIEPALRPAGGTLIPDREGFIDLFAKSLDGWDGPRNSWVWEGDVLACLKGGNLRSKTTFQDFILQFEVQLASGSNNGISFRHASGQGSEIQILDNTAPKHRKLKPYQYHGSLYALAGAGVRDQKPLGEWNQMSIELRGQQLWIRGNDGVTLLNLNLAETVQKVRDAHYDRGYEWAYQGALSPSGSITFLGHSGPVVRFRNIRIKDLGPHDHGTRQN